MNFRKRQVPRSWIVFLGFLAAPAGAQQPAPAAPPAGDVAKRQIGQMVLEGAPAPDPAMRERLMQYLQIRPTSLRGVSDDGQSIIIGTRFGDTNQLHLVKTPLGMRKQITFFDEPIGGGGFLPKRGNRHLLFSKDKGGDEKAQYYHLNLDDGRYTLLTDGKARNTDATVSKSGRWLAFNSTARNEKDFDVYLRDLNGDAPAQMIWQVEGNYSVADFSPDESKLLITKYVSERETQWFLFDLAGKRAAPLTPPDPPVYYGGGAWSADGKAVYLTSDKEGEFRKLYRLDLEYGKWQCLTSNIEWDIDEVAVDPAGKGIAFVSNEDGVSRLYFADPWGNGRKKVEGLPEGVLSALHFAHNGGVLGCTINTWRAPSDAYTISFPDGKPTRWTESEVGGLNPEKFIEPQLIHYPTFDQASGKPRMIPAFYFKAPQPGPRPVVIFVHGGPEGQERPAFSGTFQFWLNELGLSVLVPNVRGSTGYGRSYHQLDNAVLRQDSVKDIGALLDWIEKQPELDSKRVGVFGGSYGGFMVLASLTSYPERFKAGIDIVGIASLVSFLQTTPEYRRDLRREEYGDERKPDVKKILEEVSPLNKADKIKAALFVVHGKNDPRVPYTEAEQIVAKMRELKRPVWYALALDEGHGFGKKPNRDLAAALYAMFWQEHLLK